MRKRQVLRIVSVVKQEIKRILVFLQFFNKFSLYNKLNLIHYILNFVF